MEVSSYPFCIRFFTNLRDAQESRIQKYMNSNSNLTFFVTVTAFFLRVSIFVLQKMFRRPDVPLRAVRINSTSTVEQNERTPRNAENQLEICSEFNGTETSHHITA